MGVGAPFLPAVTQNTPGEWRSRHLRELPDTSLTPQGAAEVQGLASLASLLQPRRHSSPGCFWGAATSGPSVMWF